MTRGNLAEVDKLSYGLNIFSPIKQFYNKEYTSCTVNCPTNDFVCASECAREYDKNKQNCPCQPGCPDGCPCPIYQCPSTSSAVLVLNHPFESFSNVPIITNGNGLVEYPVIVYDKNTEVYQSCSVIWHGELFIFGGYLMDTQISKLTGCKLERIATLPFQHRFGACGIVNENTFFLCFNDNKNDYKKCRTSTQPTGDFSEIAASKHDHRWTRIGTSPGMLTYSELL